MDLIEKVDREYRIQSESARAFRATIPRSFSRTSEVQKGDELGIKVGIKNSHGIIDLHPNPSSEMVTRDVAGSNHLIRIPASIGSSMQLRRDMFKWELYKNSQDEFVFRLNTPYIPLIISDQRWEHFSKKDMKPTITDNKEHFSFYIQKELKNKLGWTQNTEIGYLIAQRDGSVCIRCQPNKDNNKELFTTQLNPINKGSEQLRTYVPRSLVRATEFQDKDLEILVNDNALSLTSI